MDLPTVIVEERIRNEFNVGEIGKKLEQGVTRLGHKNLIAGIAEQTEDVRVGFAGAGGQNQAFGSEIDKLVRLARVAALGLRRCEQPATLRLGIHRLRIGQRGERGCRVAAEPYLST